MGMFKLDDNQYAATAATTWYRRPKRGTPQEVHDAVEDFAWQMFRGVRLKGQDTAVKLDLLADWLNVWVGTPYESIARVQVENYLGALKRGGFIKDDWAAQGEVPGEEFFGQFWGVIK